MQRGEVWLVNVDDSIGKEAPTCRPAVILSVNALNRARGTVVVVPLSASAQSRPPIAIALPSARLDAVAVCDQLCAADKKRFKKKVCDLSGRDLAALTDATKTVLGLG